MNTKVVNSAPQSQSDGTSIAYRPDIDGLRAIAVLAVVGYHTFPDLIPGGFIGVDIFFVISGYLISSIIFKNLTSKSFSFFDFYSRRIRRIFPSLIAILVFSYIIGWYSLLEDEYSQLGKHIAAGAGFLSNFVLLNESGYFDNYADTKPLLHLWSLGIEEQFYICWPFLIYIIWRIRLNLYWLIIPLGLFTFLLNIYYSNTNQIIAFYLPQTRFWELMTGSALAWNNIHTRNLTFHNPSPNLHPKHSHASNASTICGMSLLIFGLFFIDRSLRYPGLWALIPVLSASLLVYKASNTWVNQKILENKIIIWIGLISFPLYLWHWSLISFLRIIGSSTPDASSKIIIIFLSIILAWLTYEYIEKPIRKDIDSRYSVATLLILMLTIGFIGYITYSKNGIESRTVVKQNFSSNSWFDGGSRDLLINECGFSDKKIQELFLVCAQDKRGNIRYALMGDSKADAMFPGLVRTSTEKGGWLFIGGSSKFGAPTPLLSFDPDPKRPLTNYAMNAIINNKDIQIVVLIAAIRELFFISDSLKNESKITYNYKYLELLNSSPRFNDVFQELNTVVGKFIKAGKKVVLVIDNPALPDADDCINRITSSNLLNIFARREHNPDCSISLSEFNSQIVKYRNLLGRVKILNGESVKIFDPTDIYCDLSTDKCESIKNKRLMYTYTDHISDYAAGLVGVKLNKILAEW